MTDKEQEQEENGMIDEGKLCLFAFFEKSMCVHDVFI